ncbi:protein kinase, partial [Mariniblastus sp.]|nr:protein kinase [Mariniblastus sp.]
MSDDSPESLGDDPTYVGRGKEREDQSLGEQSTYAGSNESSLSDLDGLGGSLEDGLDGLEIVDLESRYTIIRPLGKGGMGEVFLATDTRLNRKVAIKRIKDELTTPAAAARFLTEAKSIAALSHPYIVQVYDYGRAKDGPFLIMEYVEGQNLQQVCNQGVMALEDAVDLSCKLCDALSKAHGLGIIHRDIKPANILMTEEGWPKISDFGLAKSTNDHGHTMTGTALGTLDFMPPEQRRDASAVDHRSDLWSLAATIYQMVTGEPPKVIDLEEVPPVLRTVLGKALKTQPDKRYQSAKSLKDDIEQCNSSGALPIGQLNIGECPSCNTRNESNRKYCRECAASLVTDCLGCGESIAVWDKICGECGNNQEEALKAKLSEYTRLQEDAEGLQLSYRYEEAIELSKQIGEDYASISQDAAAWAEKFTADTKRDQAEQLEKTEKIYDAAKKARLNYDYRSACQMMEEIPEPLRLGELKDFLETAEREHNEVQRLQREINDRLNSKNLDGLLPLVEQLLKLQPERSSVKRLHKKHVKWKEKAFAEAKKLFDFQDYSGCLKQVARIDHSLVNEDIRLLQDQATSKLNRLKELRDTISAGVRSKKLNGLLAVVKEALQLDTAAEDLNKLCRQLIEREQKNAAAVASILKNARLLRQQCQFEAAEKLLGQISEDLTTEESTNLQIDCQNLGLSKNEAIEALRMAIQTEDYQRGLNLASVYRTTLAAEGLTDGSSDGSFNRAYTACQSAKKVKLEAAAKRQKTIVIRAGIAALVVVVITVGAYLAIQSAA